MNRKASSFSTIGWIIRIITIILLIFIAFHLAQAAPTVTVIEAENMTAIGPGGNRAAPDGWVLLGAGALKTNVDFKTTSPQLEIIARGDYAGAAWPKMEVKIAGVLYDTLVIDSATWKTFSVSAEIIPGPLIEVTFSFINDFYEGTPETDRNLYIDKATFIEAVIPTHQVTLMWDPNKEDDLEGYKIHYGETSRKNTIGAIAVWCLTHEPDNSDCYDEWTKICTEPDAKGFAVILPGETTQALLAPVVDPACHPMLYSYDTVVDVKNVTQFTVTGLEEGKVYYFAATVYNTAKTTSAFSKELTHRVDIDADPPANPGGVTRRIEGLSDTVKGKSEEIK